MAPSEDKIVAEYAKSNRSLCKECSQAISSKDLRLGLVTRGPGGFDMTKWHHLDCFSMSINSTDAIGGFDSLKSCDQDALKKLISNGSTEVGGGSPKRNKENEEEFEQEERISKKTKRSTENEEKFEQEERISKESKKKNSAIIKMAPSEAKIVAEYAKSNRSLCKECSQAISSKALRLGLVTRGPGGFDMTKWHHLDCFSVSINSTDTIGGFASLKSCDQDALKKLISDGSTEVPDGSPKRSRENEEEFEQEETVSKESKKKNSETTKMAPSEVKIIAEYAKSNRSSCKKCSQVISSKALRLGLVTRGPGGFDMTKWHHLDCLSISITSTDAIEGFSSLQSCDQDALKKLISNGSTEVPDLSSANEEVQLEIAFSRAAVRDKYKDALLLPKWKAFQTVIFLERDDGLNDSNKIAAFDFDGCLVDASFKRKGASALPVKDSSISEKLQGLYKDGYKLVIFTNEANIDRQKNTRQKAVDSKIGRLNNFIGHMKVPIQVFIACAESKVEDPFRKPKPGMWQIMEKHFNSGISIDMDQSFYVGDAAGRKTDFSDSDLKFAQAIGLKFFVPEDYFGA